MTGIQSTDKANSTFTSFVKNKGHPPHGGKMTTAMISQVYKYLQQTQDLPSIFVETKPFHQVLSVWYEFELIPKKLSNSLQFG